MRAVLVCEPMLLRRNPSSGTERMATVTSVPVLLFKTRCMFLPMSRLVCALSQKEVLVPFFPFCQSFSVEPAKLPTFGGYSLETLPYLLC